MTDLYLIAHKVSGEPAFDVACQIDCPECSAFVDYNCSECDSLGYWWIISTSGHRAYPWWHLPLNITDFDEGMRLVMDHNPDKLTWTIFPMPPDLPDHYTTTYDPTPRRSLVDLLNLRPKPSTTPFPRRL